MVRVDLDLRPLTAVTDVLDDQLVEIQLLAQARELLLGGLDAVDPDPLAVGERGESRPQLVDGDRFGLRRAAADDARLHGGERSGRSRLLRPIVDQSNNEKIFWNR